MLRATVDLTARERPVSSRHRALQFNQQPLGALDEDLRNAGVRQPLDPESVSGNLQLGGLALEIIAGKGDMVDPADLAGSIAWREVDHRQVAEIEPIAVERE